MRLDLNRADQLDKRNWKSNYQLCGRILKTASKQITGHIYIFNISHTQIGMTFFSVLTKAELQKSNMILLMFTMTTTFSDDSMQSTF